MAFWWQFPAGVIDCSVLLSYGHFWGFYTYISLLPENLFKRGGSYSVSWCVRPCVKLMPEYPFKSWSDETKWSINLNDYMFLLCFYHIKMVKDGVHTERVPEATFFGSHNRWQTELANTGQLRFCFLSLFPYSYTILLPHRSVRASHTSLKLNVCMCYRKERRLINTVYKVTGVEICWPNFKISLDCSQGIQITWVKGDS